MRHNIIAVCAIVALVTPLAAQQSQSTQSAEKASSSPVVVKSMEAGVMAGRALADQQGTTVGSFVAGLAGGVLLGLMGTTLVYVAQGPAELPPKQMQNARHYGLEYAIGLQQGFAEKSKSRKQSSALAGGLLGTAAFVAVYLGAQ